MDNHSQLLTDLPKKFESDPCLVMKECLKAAEQLLAEIEKDFFDIYNLSDAFLSAPPVQPNLLKFYSSIHGL